MATSVPSFYAGRYAFITGATGFLGKCLVEKLIRSCPDIAGIYVLVRSKRGVDPKQRVQDLVNGDLFETLRATKPNFAEKILPIVGDLEQDGLGISPADVEILRRDVSVVFHVAATVNFNEPIKLALRLNVISVQQLLGLARSFPKLAAFVHTSTAYSQCDRPHIEEKIYDAAVDPQALIKLIDSVTPEVATAITPGVIGKRPNTYTLTKSLAEVMVKEHGANMPVAIMRPSIVAGVRADPVRGWQDNLNGPGGMYVSSSAGLLRVMNGKSDVVMDLVPVDHCVALLIAIGWKVGTQYRAGDDITVYHCTSGTTNPCTWGEQIHYALSAYKTADPLVVPLIRPSFRFIENKFIFDIAAFFLHKVPCYMGDLALRASGQKPVLHRIYRKLDNATSAFQFFISHEWKWDMDNTIALRKELSSVDRETFQFDMDLISWPSYIESFFHGARRFIPKQSESEAARNRIMQPIIATVFNLFLLLALLYVVLAAFNFATDSNVTPVTLLHDAVSAVTSHAALPAPQAVHNASL